MTLRQSKDATAGERERSGTAPRTGGPAAALRSGVGNAAMVQLLRAAGHPWAQEEAQEETLGETQGEPQGVAGEPAVQRSAVHEVLRAPGRPLDAATRTDMEQRLGADFSDVRIHDDAAARTSAAEVGARAYTSGRHVVLGAGGTDPHTLAHELTHVVQQRHGPVAGTDNGAGLKVSDPSDRFEREAEATATRVMRDPVPAPAPDAPVQPAHDHAHDHAHAQGAVPVARLVTREQFQEGTKVPLNMRPSELKGVDDLLGQYHRLALEKYEDRRAKLAQIQAAAAAALGGRLNAKRRPAVETLHAQVAAELAVYARLAAAAARPELEVPGALLDAYEYVLRLSQSGAADREFRLLPATVSNDFTKRTGFLITRRKQGDQQAAAALDAMLEADVEELRRMAVDNSAPAETRAVLTEVLALRNSVDLTIGLPGTKRIRTPGARPYAMTHALEQPGGKVERLGSLAHEMTHVAAGESFRNTDILLLCRSGLTREQMEEIARNRADDADNLKGLLDEDMLNAEQRELITFKLAYLTKPGQFRKYVENFMERLNTEDATRARMLHDIAKGPNAAQAASLVEYDTVLTQLLVYLHSWGVPADNAFHAEVRRLAAAQQLARTEAAAVAAAE